MVNSFAEEQKSSEIKKIFEPTEKEGSQNKIRLIFEDFFQNDAIKSGGKILKEFNKVGKVTFTDNIINKICNKDKNCENAMYFDDIGIYLQNGDSVIQVANYNEIYLLKIAQNFLDNSYQNYLIKRKSGLTNQISGIHFCMQYYKILNVFEEKYNTEINNFLKNPEYQNITEEDLIMIQETQKSFKEVAEKIAKYKKEVYEYGKQAEYDNFFKNNKKLKGFCDEDQFSSNQNTRQASVLHSTMIPQIRKDCVYKIDNFVVLDVRQKGLIIADSNNNFNNYAAKMLNKNARYIETISDYIENKNENIGKDFSGYVYYTGLYTINSVNGSTQIPAFKEVEFIFAK